jgi:hypothetical protein
MANGTTTEYLYIPAGDGLAAVYIKPSGAGTLYYVHKDHLGSITTITDANDVLTTLGAVVGILLIGALPMFLYQHF